MKTGAGSHSRYIHIFGALQIHQGNSASGLLFGTVPSIYAAPALVCQIINIIKKKFNI
jgi:hypothetical protein